MNRRPMGSTGMDVSEIGLGAWQLANPDWNLHDTGEALHIVAEALDLGCNFFDTAPGYGNGRSETLLGEALKGVRDRVFICTKFSGHTPEGATNFDVKALRPTLENSLRRLQTDAVDILLMHNPPREMMDGNHSPHYEVMEQLKEEGKLRAYGVSLDWREELEMVVNTTGSQAVEVMFNVFYQEPLAAFKLAKERGVGLIIKVPLDSGWLSGRYTEASQFDDIRRRWSSDVISRRGRLVREFAALVPPGTSLAHAALQYILAQPEVSTVIPGPKTVAQVRDNFAAADNSLPAETVAAIYAMWKKELEADPLPW